MKYNSAQKQNLCILLALASTHGHAWQYSVSEQHVSLWQCKACIVSVGEGGRGLLPGGCSPSIELSNIARPHQPWLHIAAPHHTPLHSLSHGSARRPQLAALEHLTWLDMSGCGLTALPPAVAALPGLHHLDLELNALTALPASVSEWPGPARRGFQCLASTRRD
jgi:hypothetical protein